MISLICSIYKNKKQKQIHNTEDKPRVARKRGGGGGQKGVKGSGRYRL